MSLAAALGVLLSYGQERALAQELEATRWSAFEEGELEAFFSELFSAVTVPSDDPAAHALGIAARLRLGDEARLHFIAFYQDSAASLYVDLLNDLGTLVRLRSAGKVFDGAAAVFRRHRRRTLLPIDGQLHVDVSEAPPRHGATPELALFLRTKRPFSCLGYRIEGELRRQGQHLHLQLLGIEAPHSVCAPAIGPARMRRSLSVEPGHYTLQITRAGQVDQYALEVTDSSAQLRAERTNFTEADTRLKWRFPPNGFALSCKANAVLCTEVRRWLSGRSRIEPMEFPSGGVVPYRYGKGGDYERSYFRYTSEAALEEVRRCLAEIEDRIRDAVGLSLHIETSGGRLAHAVSERAFHEPHIDPPHEVTAGCSR